MLGMVRHEENNEYLTMVDNNLEYSVFERIHLLARTGTGD
jgi:hypothetical protein